MLNGVDTYSALDAIGKTPLVRLKRIVPVGHAGVWLKLEGTNPTGSYKDRMAVAQILSAIGAGRLDNATPVECTGGSTGTSVAFVCAAVGTGGMLIGAGRRLKQALPEIAIVAV